MPRRRLPPAVHLPGYTIVVEPNGVLVYTYTRAVGLEEASPAAACKRRLPRPPPAELDSDQGSTASDDSEESMTPPDHDKGEPYLVQGRPMLTCRIEPHQRRRVMQILAEGVHNEHTRRVRKYKRYLRRMRREAEAEAEQDLGAAFASLGLAPAEGNAHFNSSDLADRPAFAPLMEYAQIGRYKKLSWCEDSAKDSANMRKHMNSGVDRPI